jgi:16S rRNA (uracil1498-N3)-methyltransferase
MSERFFLSTPPAAGRAVLTGDAARHLGRVLRARPGDAVTLFDGRGRRWTARVARVDRDSVALDIAAECSAPSPRGPRLTLAAALPKGERQKWLVEKLTELGVHAFVPLDTARGVAEAGDAARTRLGRVVIEACKQCGRDTLMEIGESRPLAALLAGAATGVRIVIADPHGGPLDGAATAGIAAASTVETLGLVGPEGGFTAEELATADTAGAIRVSLGPHILRVETAAIALAARFA